MKREAQPGDVALVRNEWKVWNVAICTLREGRPGWWWRYGVADSWSPIANPDVRPLAVIDPEDREQGERLARAIEHEISEVLSLDDEDRRLIREAVQPALREFANPTPPKPDEPRGWLAAVEDADGNRWCIHGGPVDPPMEWYSPDLNESRAYSDIAAVRVLSEGVPS